MLKNFVDVDDLSVYEVAERLTMSGLEVEGVEDLSQNLRNCVVGIITEVKDHPNAGKLKVLRVFDGKEELTIVCGAPNVREGLKVAVALPGATLPNGSKVEVSSIRGVDSSGMLLSEIELGLVDETWGILELGERAEPGDPLAPYVFMDDFVLEVSPTPNRGDCFGVLGVAREVATIYRRPLRFPNVSVREGEESIEEFVNIIIEDTHLCPRYTGRFISGVKIDESPLWLKVKIKACGMRPISNVVDVTNYVLMEVGHPLHAFDYERLRGAKIIVRRAKEGEFIVTLDNEFRELDPEILVIADAERPVAIAGIMGGANSEVTRTTDKILLESAYFDPLCIRRGSKKLALSTEASKRFERGTDIENLVYALDRATQLIQEIAGGDVARGIADVYPEKIDKPKVFLRLDRVDFILGVEVSLEEKISVLEHLGFEVVRKNKGLDVVVPYHRIHDVTREIDLIEEIARIWGYDKVPSSMPSGSIPTHIMDSDYSFVEGVKEYMVASGFYEIINYSFISPKFAELLKLAEDDPRRDAVKLMNPLSEEMSVMRTMLLPGLLDTALRNQRVRVEDFSFFEIGRVFLGSGVEVLNLGMVAAGNLYRHWSGKKKADFYDLKGVLEGLFYRLGVAFRFVPSKEVFLHPGKSADVMVDDRVIGFVGCLHPDVVEAWDLKGEVFVAELSLEDLKGLRKIPRFEPIPRFPENTRDLSFIAPRDLSFESIYQFILSCKVPELKKVELIDVYEGPPIEEGKRSMTLTFVFVSPERTLSDEEVDEIFWGIAQKLEREFPITLRTRR